MSFFLFYSRIADCMNFKCCFRDQNRLFIDYGVLAQKKEAKKPTATPYFSAKRATATTASAISSFLRVQKLFVRPCCLALLRKITFTDFCSARHSSSKLGSALALRKNSQMRCTVPVSCKFALYLFSWIRAGFYW